MERDEVKDLITAQTAGPLARIEASVLLIEKDINQMNGHLATVNGNTARNVLQIEEIRKKTVELEATLPHTELNCPQSEALKEIQSFVDEAKHKKKLRSEFGEAVLKTRTEKRAEVMKVLTTVSVFIAALALLANLTFSVIGYYQKKDIKSEIIQSNK